ncbi:MAG: hypothetical protein ACJAZN_000014 [Planctomycetota bacterium]|jgi:uncharacterized protein YciI
MIQKFGGWLRFRSCCAVLALVGVGAGCASSPGAAGGEYAAADFTLVFLRAGPSAGSIGEELIRSHTEFLEELAETGALLFSGWFGPTRAEADLRGILLMDIADQVQAAELLLGDPASLAGVLTPELVPLTTLDVIRVLPMMETARQHTRAEAAENMARADIRAYTILTVPDGPEAARTIFRHPAIGSQVVLMGRMLGPRQDELFAILAVPTARELHSRLDLANEKRLEVHVSEWFGSPVIAELAGGGGPPEGIAVPDPSSSGPAR